MADPFGFSAEIGEAEIGDAEIGALGSVAPAGTLRDYGLPVDWRPPVTRDFGIPIDSIPPFTRDIGIPVDVKPPFTRDVGIPYEWALFSRDLGTPVDWRGVLTRDFGTREEWTGVPADTLLIVFNVQQPLVALLSVQFSVANAGLLEFLPIVFSVINPIPSLPVVFRVLSDIQTTFVQNDIQKPFGDVIETP